MGKDESYKALFAKLKPGNYELVETERKTELIQFITDPDNELHFKFPESYTSFIKEIGFGYFSNDYFNIFMFERKMFLGFNTGEDSHPELKDYIVFAYDDRNSFYFFDKDDKLKKGKNAVFRIRMDELEDDYAIFLAEDFAELFKLLSNNQELNDKWLKEEKPDRTVSKNETLSERQIKEKLSGGPKLMYEKVVEMISGMNKNSISRFLDKDRMDVLECIPGLEKSQGFAYPESYIDFIRDVKIIFIENDYFQIEFFNQNALMAVNAGKLKNPVLKDFIVFGHGFDMSLYFIDVNNILKKGKNAIFKIKSEKPKSTEDACYLARDFVELVMIFTENRRPNKIPLKDEK